MVGKAVRVRSNSEPAMTPLSAYHPFSLVTKIRRSMFHERFWPSGLRATMASVSPGAVRRNVAIAWRAADVHRVRNWQEAAQSELALQVADGACRSSRGLGRLENREGLKLGDFTRYRDRRRRGPERRRLTSRGRTSGKACFPEPEFRCHEPSAKRPVRPVTRPRTPLRSHIVTTRNEAVEAKLAEIIRRRAPGRLDVLPAPHANRAERGNANASKPFAIRGQHAHCNHPVGVQLQARSSFPRAEGRVSHDDSAARSRSTTDRRNRRHPRRARTGRVPCGRA